MAKTKVQVGDIILIPVDGKFFAARVLFISKEFKKMMLIDVDTTHVHEKAELPQHPLREPGLRIYTATTMVEAGKWPKAGSDTATPIDPNASLRIVAGHIYLKDEAIRPMSPEDVGKLPMQAIAGFIAVENKIRQALGQTRS